MALEGTLRDFSLADIYQLIGIQRKTGVLTLKKEGEIVTISFLNGNVVSADSSQKNLEDRLGTVLVKSGHITPRQLQAALRVQKNTLQRLGFVLVNQQSISQDDLREALQLQVLQIVYRLFRWKDGDYHFSQEETLDYDKENFTPISSQSILMEGIRMIDEWPLIERKIRSYDMIFEKVDPDLRVEAIPEEEDDDLELAFGDEGDAAEEVAKPAPESDAVQIPAEFVPVYERVDGVTNVQEMIDICRLGDFDTCRVLFELVQRELVREVRATRPRVAKASARPRKIRNWIPAGYVAMVAIASISLLTAALNPLNLLPVPIDESPTVDSFKRIMSRNRVEQIDHALYLYFLEHQRLAPSLTALVAEGFVDEDTVVDPWGRYYAYEIFSGGYRIVGFDNGGVEDASLARVRHFPSGLLPEGNLLQRAGTP